MRAMQALSYGGPEVLELVALPIPEPGPGEVLVRVAAAGVNPVDWKARAGHIPEWWGDGPYVWGWDVSGTVVAVGPAVFDLAVGDEVYGMPNFPNLAGGYAEYVTAPAYHLAAKPASVDHAAAAALPLAALTALQMLDLAAVTAGHRVLVHAAAGGVGHLTTQLAKVRGAHVLGTARAENHQFLRSVGVDEPIDYSTTDVTALRDLDAVIDGMGDPGLLATVRPGGVLAPVAGGASLELAAAAAAVGVRTVTHLVHPDGAALTRLAGLVDAGLLRVEVAERLPLTEAGKAHELLAEGHVRGKIVLTM